MKTVSRRSARIPDPLPCALLLLAVTPLLAARPAPAQNMAPVPVFDATRVNTPTNLDGLWRLHAGDDPAYANPNFDDSGWTPFDPFQPVTNLFPKDHPEILWYRLHLRVDPTQAGLALREQTLSRAFAIYGNGELLLANGQIAPFMPYTYDARLVAPIPTQDLATGSLVLALRVHISDLEWRDSAPGFAAGNLAIGQAATFKDQDWLAVIGDKSVRWLDDVLLGAVGIVALALFLAQRRHIEYFWVFALGMSQCAELPIKVLTQFRNIPTYWSVLNASFYLITPLVWGSLYFAFAGQRIGWRFRAFLLVAGLLHAYNNLGSVLPLPTGAYALLSDLPFIVLLSIVIPAVLAIHWRRGNREAGILLVPAALFSLYIYADYILAILYRIPAWSDAAVRGLDLIQRFPAGPFSISLENVSDILSTVALAIIMVLRSGSTSRRQAQLEGELEAAREVQQVILPEQIETIPGFAIESAYAPAQQVGGDFFQILPTGEGGLLLVLGDVAGKGLPAAMLVSVLVGATRTAAAYSHSPAEILAQLNERLIGRARGGFSTALAASISASGTVTIANAGHLSPYMDGCEIDLPGALPLGIVGGARYESVQFSLPPGSRLTFYSDGVVEAQNPRGELLGFDRSRELSTQPAAAIVEAAKQFGQSDDITVVAIARAATAAAPA